MMLAKIETRRLDRIKTVVSATAAVTNHSTYMAVTLGRTSNVVVVFMAVFFQFLLVAAHVVVVLRMWKREVDREVDRDEILNRNTQANISPVRSLDKASNIMKLSIGNTTNVAQGKVSVASGKFHNENSEDGLIRSPRESAGAKSATISQALSMLNVAGKTSSLLRSIQLQLVEQVESMELRANLLVYLVASEITEFMVF